MAKRNLDILVCPECHRCLRELESGLECSQCGSFFNINKYGFIELILDKAVNEIDTTTKEYAEIQELSSVRTYKEYVKPLLIKEQFKMVLNVGCGIGRELSLLREEGYDAYGIDIPSLSRFWSKSGNDPGHFFCCDAARMPFSDDFFDVTYSLGVIEHIGTKNGHSLLSHNYWELRQRYANEILRVTKPGGRIIIACPNKSFPIDIQHGPENSPGLKNRFRVYIFKKMGINIHPVFGTYHLLSYREVKRLFGVNGGTHSFEPLPLKGYFGFTAFKSSFLKPFLKLATVYVNNLPGFLRTSFLNPYILAQIRK